MKDKDRKGNRWKSAQLPLSKVQLEALALDDAAVRLCHGQGALDLAIGETLLRLFEGDRLLQLGYSKRVDYLRERLGIPAKTAFGWTRLARELASRPLLRRAVMVGKVTPRKALVVIPLAVGEDEKLWTGAAMIATVRALQEAIRAHGGEPLGDSFEVEVIWLKMTLVDRDRLDVAIALAREGLGFAAPRWKCLEVISQEWLGTFGGWAFFRCRDWGGEAKDGPASKKKGRKATRAWRERMRKQARAVERQLRALEEALSVVGADGENGGAGAAGAAGGKGALDGIEGLEGLGTLASDPVNDDPVSLDARVRRLLVARQRHREVLGSLLARIVDTRAWQSLGFGCLAEYCLEQLGMSRRTARQYVWLERQMCALPELREALTSGRLTQAWSVQTQARQLDEGEALAIMADHFVEVWTAHREPRTILPRRFAAVTIPPLLMTPNGREPRTILPRRFAVLTRHGGFCAVPGCSRQATL